MPNPIQRVTIQFQGRVQGVGFRLTVADLAGSFEVTGRVCNVADGSVRLIAEGESAVLVEFVEAIRTRMGRNIVRDDAVWEEAGSRKWANFAIDADVLQ